MEGKSSDPGLYLALPAIAVLVMAINGGVNLAIDRIADCPLRNSPRLAPLITAVGMSFILEGALFVWRGPNNWRPAGSSSRGHPRP